MATPVSETDSSPIDVAYKSRWFFEAKDYAPHAKTNAKKSRDQENVSAYRSEQVGRLVRLRGKMGVAFQTLRVADECGLIPNSVDILVALVDELHDGVHELAKNVDNAEARYDERFLAGLSTNVAEAVLEPVIEA